MLGHHGVNLEMFCRPPVLRLQGIVYPVSHRSLRNEFGALRNNCETQSEKVRIKKIKRETVQLCIANRVSADR